MLKALFKNYSVHTLAISFFAVCFIFLFGMKYDYLQSRFLFLILLIPIFFKVILELRNKNYKFIKYFFLVFTLISSHIGINLFFENLTISTYSLFGIVFFLSTFVIAYYYHIEINDNLNLLISIFFALFFISIIASSFNYRNDAPFFCGGVPDFLNLVSTFESYGAKEPEINYINNLSIKKIAEFRLSFLEFIFTENSHLGMIAPGVLAYSIFKIIEKPTSKLFIFSTVVFFIICIIKSSTTLFVGVTVSLIGIVLLNFKSFNKKTIFIYSLIVIGALTTLFSSTECKSRFVPIYGETSNINPNDTKVLVMGGINDELAFKTKKLLKNSGNISAAVYFHSLSILKKSIIERPFGWGLNRYDAAFNYFNNLDTPKRSMIKVLNNKDGSNNLVKILVEFGVFGILFYLFALLYTINKSVPIELKLFFIPLIATQSLRGAGYFNGGFALIVFLMIFSYIKSKNEINP